MNRTISLILGAVLIALLSGLYLVNTINPDTIDSERSPAGTASSTESTYTDSATGLSFAYPSTYHLEMMPSAQSDHAKTLILIDKAEYEALLDSETPREGPPSLTIQIFENTKREWSRLWAENHPSITNIHLIQGEATETVVGGANAIRYTADGLYPTDTVVVAHGSYAFVFSGAYMDANSPTKRDFEPLINSVTFLPEEGS